MITHLRIYRRWRGRRWAKVSGLLWGLNWVRVTDACIERVDEDYR